MVGVKNCPDPRSQRGARSSSQTPDRASDSKRNQEDLCLFNKKYIIQVFVDILENSMKFSNPKDKIFVDISAFSKKKILISISDNGPGISKKEQKKIFDSFSIKYKSESKIEGIGLGLPIVKEIIELHGEKIWIDKNQIKGTRICFTLPIN